MWEWNHFQDEGWISHTKRSARLAVLLLGSGLVMILHMLVPFLKAWSRRRTRVNEKDCSARICPDNFYSY